MNLNALFMSLMGNNRTPAFARRASSSNHNSSHSNSLRRSSNDVFSMFNSLSRASGSNHTSSSSRSSSRNSTASITRALQGAIKNGEDFIAGSKFSDLKLDSIIGEKDQLNDGKTGSLKQYKSTVDTAYGWNVDPNKGYTITDGKYAGKTVYQVNVGELEKDGLLSDWNLSELEDAFGEKYGDLDAKVNKNSKSGLQDLDASKVVGKDGGGWQSTSAHLSEAQKNLDKAKELKCVLEKYQDNNCAPPACISKLQQTINSLMARAEKHYQCAQTTNSPIVFDMDGNGKIDLTSVQNGIQFDIDGDGQKDQVAWTEAKGSDTDAWLALADENGKITSGKQLFGNQWGDANGYDRLKQFDSNGDNVIDRKDSIYAKLTTWQDINHNGEADAGELRSLDASGVESISLSYTESDEKDNFGNELRQQSSFTRLDAAARLIAERLGISVEQAKKGLAIDAWLVTRN